MGTSGTQSCDAEDSDLLSRVRSRDPDALIVLYQKYSPRVFSLLCRILEDNSTAEELLQDTFYRLWTRVELFDGTKGSLLSWLFTIARNIALDFKRKESRRGNLYVPLEGEQSGSSQAGLLHEMALAGRDDNNTEAVREAMKQLPDEQRKVIELAYWEGLTQQELAVRLGQPLGTVKTRTRLAFKKLREKLPSDWRFYSR